MEGGSLMELTDSLVAWYDLGQLFEENFPAHNLVPPHNFIMRQRPIVGPVTFPTSAPGLVRGTRRNRTAGTCVEFPAYDPTGLVRASLSTPATGAFALTGDRTFAFWFNVKSWNQFNGLMASGLGYVIYDYALTIDNTTKKIKFGKTQGPDVVYSHNTVINLNQTYFVVFRYDSTAGQFRVSLNARPPVSGAVTPPNTGLDFFIGDNGSIQGLIDELAVWERLLGYDEERELYNDGDGLTYADITGANLPECRSSLASCGCSH
jgi:hypothetical protein